MLVILFFSQMSHQLRNNFLCDHFIALLSIQRRIQSLLISGSLFIKGNILNPESSFTSLAPLLTPQKLAMIFFLFKASMFIFQTCFHAERLIARKLQYQYVISSTYFSCLSSVSLPFLRKTIQKEGFQVNSFIIYSCPHTPFLP